MSLNAPVEPTPPLFEGWASGTTGGAGGTTIHVTNLNASGAGSFKEAIDTVGARIIEFDVGGVINLDGLKLVNNNPDLTILGQTAPSPGITFIRGTLVFTAGNTIVQHIRIRTGENDNPPLSWGATPIVCGGVDVVIDHCSLSWGTDETLSVGGNWQDGETDEERKANTAHRVTFSNNIVSEALDDSTDPNGPHSAGTLVQDNVTEMAILRNVYASNRLRNPLFKAGAQGVVVNNYIFNPGDVVVQYVAHQSEWTLYPLEDGKMTVIGNIAERGLDTKNPSEGLMYFFNAVVTGGLPTDVVDLYFDDNMTIGEVFSVLDIWGSQVNEVGSPPVWHDTIQVLPASLDLKEKVLDEAGGKTLG